jgi:hypothetical protein
MSAFSKSFFAVFILIAIFVSPVLADVSQGAGSVVTGDGNTIIQKNTADTNIDKATIYVKEDINAPTHITINNEAPVDFSPNVNYLSVGDVDNASFMIFPHTVVALRADAGTKLKMKSAGVLVVYTIELGNDVIELNSDYSMFEFNRFYKRFEHGTVSPISIFPYYTNKCEIESVVDGYIVLDNRGQFEDYIMVETFVEPPFPVAE